jgi:type II secretory ATPase GspE/PulE/Tfp pilus assembly ATPase PilB-like protein
MAVEPYLLSSTLLGVLAQRLVRRICPKCQEGSRLPKELQMRYPGLSVVYRGRGCRHCRQTGFAGRLGVFELLVVDEPMRAQVGLRAPSHSLKSLAVEHGMKTMRSDGLLKVQQGLTTLEELERVVPPDLTGQLP